MRYNITMTIEIIECRRIQYQEMLFMATLPDYVYYVFHFSTESHFYHPKVFADFLAAPFSACFGSLRPEQIWSRALDI